MPRREPPPRTPDDRTISDFDHEFESVFERLAAEEGQPAGTDKMSEAEMDRLWALRDPRVDYDTLAGQLMTQGLQPEQAQSLRVVQAMKDMDVDWLPLYGQPTHDAELASQLAHYAEFPMRPVMLLDYDDPDEQRDVSDRLQARYERVYGRQEESPRTERSGLTNPVPVGGGASQLATSTPPELPNATTVPPMPPAPVQQMQSAPVMPSMVGG